MESPENTENEKPEEAVEEVEATEAETTGEAEAAYRIGLLYVKGEGVVRSVPDAAIWYERAARLGNVEAQFQLGLIFLQGEKPLLGPHRHETWRRGAQFRSDSS